MCTNKCLLWKDSCSLWWSTKAECSSSRSLAVAMLRPSHGAGVGTRGSAAPVPGLSTGVRFWKGLMLRGKNIWLVWKNIFGLSLTYSSVCWWSAGCQNCAG